MNPTALLTYGSSALAFFLYVVILRRMLRGYLDRYVALFVYVVVLLLTMVSDVALFTTDPGFKQQWAKIWYYADDLARQAGIYVLVIALIYRALSGMKKHAWVGRWLILGALALAAVFAVATHDTRIPIWMTGLVRNLSFVAMLLNLLLWMLLIRRRSLDPLLLLISSGLGIQMAGEAIGQSLRLLSTKQEQGWTTVGNLILIAAHILCLLVWAYAFRKPAVPKPATV
jgi:hypothetical protein